MMRIRKARARAFHAQQGHCFYCGLPMVFDQNDIQNFAKRHGLKQGEARQMLATAEHLRAKQDGGTDALHNIVAAHWVCNARRHHSPTPKCPQAYRNHVRRRCAQGRWHSHTSLKPEVQAKATSSTIAFKEIRGDDAATASRPARHRSAAAAAAAAG